jgi:hypothetical protein
VGVVSIETMRKEQKEEEEEEVKTTTLDNYDKENMT